jgi:hypothetical protein
MTDHEPTEVALRRELRTGGRRAATSPRRPGTEGPNEDAWLSFRRGQAAAAEPPATVTEQPLPEPPVREPMRGQAKRLRARSPAVRGLTVEVEVRHLLGMDVPVISKPDWLPADPFFGLIAERAEHHRLIAEAERAESALRALREQIAQERQRRTRQLADGTAEGRPRPDGDKLIAEAEELCVAARARLIAYADRVAGVIAERAPQWRVQLAARDADAKSAVEEARRALAATEAKAGETYGARRWLDGQGEDDRLQVTSWEQASNVQPPKPRDPEQQAVAKALSGW